MEYVLTEVDEAVGTITLNRPEKANAQNMQVLRELDEAWNRMDRDDQVKVIVFKAAGKHFSAGHDMASKDFSAGAGNVSTTNGGHKGWQADRYYDWETRHFLHYAKTWREIPKPSIAAVQGKCIAAGLMLCWPCDLIVAADNAQFSDPVVFMGIAGVEFHGHSWEFGPRKAKELLFTGDSVTAEEARQLGMVNRVVPLDELVPTTLELAHRISRQDSWALRMAKRAVNHTLDVQGFSTAVDAVFDMHQLGHMRASVVTEGRSPVLANLATMKEQNPSR
jgi:enoyl-CoA hydratase